MEPADALKTCRDCGVDKPLSGFWRNRKSPDGRALYCIACFSDRNRASATRRAAAAGRTHRVREPRPPGIGEDESFCPSCKQVLPLTAFVRNRSTSSGYGSYCRPCQNRKSAESIARRHGSSRHYHLKRRYGLGADEVLAMLEAQSWTCPICRREISLTSAHVDHDHVTGTVRGVVCFNCNGGLGQFRDDPQAVLEAARYLLTAAERRIPMELVWTERLAQQVEYGSAS